MSGDIATQISILGKFTLRNVVVVIIINVIVALRVMSVCNFRR